MAKAPQICPKCGGNCYNQETIIRDGYRRHTIQDNNKPLQCHDCSYFLVQTDFKGMMGMLEAKEKKESRDFIRRWQKEKDNG